MKLNLLYIDNYSRMDLLKSISKTSLNGLFSSIHTKLFWYSNALLTDSKIENCMLKGSVIQKSNMLKCNKLYIHLIYETHLDFKFDNLCLYKD